MSIVDGRRYLKTFHDFDIFKGCFGESRIMPTDVDFIVERKNNFLCIEFKPDDKKPFIGQEILLRRLSYTPRFTVALVYHVKGRVLHETFVATAIQVYPNGKKTNITNEDLIKFVSLWYERADKCAIPTPTDNYISKAIVTQ